MKTLIILLLTSTITFSASAQTGKSQTDSTQAILAKQGKYTCEMDTDVVLNKPGKCPKCGMTLTKIKVYTCSMHPEVVTTQPGKCPKCDMDLTEVIPANKTNVKKGNH